MPLDAFNLTLFIVTIFATTVFKKESNPLHSQLTAVGYQSLTANTTGSSNSASGYRSLAANTTGTYYRPESTTCKRSAKIRPSFIEKHR